jgi:hypothetical protein
MRCTDGQITCRYSAFFSISILAFNKIAYLFFFLPLRGSNRETRISYVNTSSLS